MLRAYCIVGKKAQMWITLNLSQLLRVLYTSSEHSGSRKAERHFWKKVSGKEFSARGEFQQAVLERDWGPVRSSKVMRSRGGVAVGQVGGKVR